METTQTRVPTEAEIAAYIAEINEFIAEDMTKSHPSLSVHRITADFSTAKKYLRLVTEGYAWGFIDLRNGDILKSAGWKTPAKHARGNIFTHKPRECCSKYGPNYLR